MRMLDPQRSTGMLSKQGVNRTKEETSNEGELSDKGRADRRSDQHTELESGVDPVFETTS
jgi:hypothetical protein